jgi:hypothetical protein
MRGGVLEAWKETFDRDFTDKVLPVEYAGIYQEGAACVEGRFIPNNIVTPFISRVQENSVPLYMAAFQFVGSFSISEYSRAAGFLFWGKDFIRNSVVWSFIEMEIYAFPGVQHFIFTTVSTMIRPEIHLDYYPTLSSGAEPLFLWVRIPLLEVMSKNIYPEIIR